MAITDFELTFERAGELGEVRTYKEQYSVLVDDLKDYYLAILKHKSCPTLFKTTFTGDKSAFCHRISPTPVADTNEWLVDVDYTTDIDDPDKDPNPLKRPAKVDIKGVSKTVPSLLNAKGYPNLNTAGEIITSQADLPFLQIGLRKNIPSYPKWVWDYLGGVNKTGIVFKKRYFAPRTLKVVDIDIPDKVFENGKWFHQLSLAFESDPRTFDEVKINSGFHELVEEKYIPSGLDPGEVNTSTNFTRKVRRRITIGKTKEYPTEPQPLDKDGKLLVNPEPKDIVILRHRNLQELDLKKLLLK